MGRLSLIASDFEEEDVKERFLFAWLLICVAVCVCVCVR